MIENGAGGKKIFVQNKKEQNVIDVAEQWCDYDSYKVLKDHFDSVTPPKVKVLPKILTATLILRKNVASQNQKQNRNQSQAGWLNSKKPLPKKRQIWTVFKAGSLFTFQMLMN